MGPLINLNGGGSAGTPVSTLQPAVLGALADDDEDTFDSDGPDDDEKYNVKFHFTDDDGIPYANTEYIAYLASGAQKKGLTNKEGETERFVSGTMDSVDIKLILDFQNN
ncbi:hypothetical protein CB015_014425 [Salmonella enterica]|nr:hypothetical protein [Salmonella enterica]